MELFEALVSIWQKSEPTFANFVGQWANFHCCKSPNYDEII